MVDIKAACKDTMLSILGWKMYFVLLEKCLKQMRSDVKKKNRIDI